MSSTQSVVAECLRIFRATFPDSPISDHRVAEFIKYFDEDRDMVAIMRNPLYMWRLMLKFDGVISPIVGSNVRIAANTDASYEPIGENFPSTARFSYGLFDKLWMRRYGLDEVVLKFFGSDNTCSLYEVWDDACHMYARQVHVVFFEFWSFLEQP
jgi:hypothetical protein